MNDEYPPVKERLEQALKEMKLMREGKFPNRTWEEVKRDLRSEKIDDCDWEEMKLSDPNLED